MAEAAQELSYQWFRDSQPLPYSTGNELYIKQVQLGDQGVYNCRVATKFGGSKLTDDCIVHGKDDACHKEAYPCACTHDIVHVYVHVSRVELHSVGIASQNLSVPPSIRILLNSDHKY